MRSPRPPKKSQPKRPKQPISQVEQFRKAAKEHECDEDEATFSLRLRAVALQPAADPKTVGKRK